MSRDLIFSEYMRNDTCITLSATSPNPIYKTNVTFLNKEHHSIISIKGPYSRHTYSIHDHSYSFNKNQLKLKSYIKNMENPCVSDKAILLAKLLFVQLSKYGRTFLVHLHKMDYGFIYST